MGEGYEKLKKSVIYDCDKYNGCFNPDGCIKTEKCNNPSCNCFQKYCDHFKWIIDRAKHYAEKTGLNWEDILNVWEKNRSYWYMNYYQNANQPLLEGNNIKIYETIEEAKKEIGKQFRCPACKGISTDPYECNSGLQITDIKHNTKEKKKIICNWKVYGLFGGLSNELYIFIKEKMYGQKIFMPIVFESVESNESK